MLRQHLHPVRAEEGTSASPFGFPMHCGPAIRRHALTQRLEAHKVGTRLVFAGNITKQPAYAGVPFRVVGTLDNTDAIMHRTFWIGVHPALSAAHITYILEQLEAGVRAQL